MAKDYKNYAQSKVPGWLQQAYGAAWVQAVADVADSLLTRIKAAVKSRFVGIAPPDAVPQIGADRNLPRGPGEALADYRARIADAWSAWVFAGTPRGILSQLKILGYTAQLAQVRGGLYTLNGDGSVSSEGVTWVFEPTDTFWSKFQVIIEPPFPWGAYGSTPASSSDTAETIRRLIRQWKSAYSTLVDIRVAEDAGAFWGAEGHTWGDGHHWGDKGVTVWSP